MEDRVEHAGVVRALLSRLSNCVEFKNDELLRRIRSNSYLQGLTPRAIKAELVEHVCRDKGGSIVQSRETRPEWPDMPYKYHVLVPFDDIPKGVYIEIVMHNPDLDPPTVLIVSVHKPGV